MWWRTCAPWDLPNIQRYREKNTYRQSLNLGSVFRAKGRLSFDHAPLESLKAPLHPCFACIWAAAAASSSACGGPVLPAASLPALPTLFPLLWLLQVPLSPFSCVCSLPLHYQPFPSMRIVLNLPDVTSLPGSSRNNCHPGSPVCFLRTWVPNHNPCQNLYH